MFCQFLEKGRTDKKYQEATVIEQKALPVGGVAVKSLVGDVRWIEKIKYQVFIFRTYRDSFKAFSA
jgi:hypothetical protein